MIVAAGANEPLSAHTMRADHFHGYVPPNYCIHGSELMQTVSMDWAAYQTL